MSSKKFSSAQIFLLTFLLTSAILEPESVSAPKTVLGQGIFLRVLIFL